MARPLSPEKREALLLSAMQAVAELGLLPPQQVSDLSSSYLFLRRLENLLQAIADEQTQTLPSDALNQARLAWGMGYIDWATMSAALEYHMQAVRLVFNDLIGDDTPDIGEDPRHGLYKSLWQDALEERDLAPLTPHLDESACRQLLTTINDFRHDVAFVAKVFDLFFCTKVIKAIRVHASLFCLFLCKWNKSFVSFGCKFKRNVTTRFHFVFVTGLKKIVE